MPDELFTPTIRERPVGGKAPWRPQSIFYPAFFGGPLPAGQLLTIGAAGLAGFAARIAVAGSFDQNSNVRLSGTIAGVLVWLVVLAFQRRPFRAFAFADGEPAGLIGAGFAAFLGCGLFEAIVIYTLVR